MTQAVIVKHIFVFNTQLEGSFVRLWWCFSTWTVLFFSTVETSLNQGAETSECKRERKGKVSHEKKRGWFACQHLNPDREAGPAERPGGEGEHSSSDFQRVLTGFLLRRPGSRQHTFLPLIAADETLMLLLSSQHLAHAKCSDPSHSKELWLSLACQTWTGLGSDTDGLRSCSVLTW